VRGPSAHAEYKYNQESGTKCGIPHLCYWYSLVCTTEYEWLTTMTGREWKTKAFEVHRHFKLFIYFFPFFWSIRWNLRSFVQI